MASKVAEVIINAAKEKAKNALEEAKGDLARAILLLTTG